MGLIDTLESIVDDMSDPEGGFMGSNAVGAILSKTQNQLKNIGLDIDLGQTFTDDQGQQVRRFNEYFKSCSFDR